MNRYYDSKLFLYQAVLEIPAQVLMLDLYNNLDNLSKVKYPVMSTVNLGSTLLTLIAAKGIYNAFHNTLSPEPDTQYYISPTSKYLYDKLSQTAINSPSSELDAQSKKLDFILDESDAYSESYYNLTYGYLGSKVAYSFFESTKMSNPLIRALYAFSQPLAVILKDQGKI